MLESLYLGMVANNCVMVVMALIQRVHSTNQVLKMHLFGGGNRMCENVFKGVSFPFPDAAACFAMEAGVHNVVERTCCSLVIALPAAL